MPGRVDELALSVAMRYVRTPREKLGLVGQVYNAFGQTGRENAAILGRSSVARLQGRRQVIVRTVRDDADFELNLQRPIPLQSGSGPQQPRVSFGFYHPVWL